VLSHKLEQAEAQLLDARRLFKSESVGHKITKDCLRSTRFEVTVLSKALEMEHEPVLIEAEIRKFES